MGESTAAPNMSPLMLVPEGASEEQINRIRQAQTDREVCDGIEWLTTNDLLDTDQATDYINHFSEDILVGQYGVKREFCSFVLKSCQRQYKQKARQHGQA